MSLDYEDAERDAWRIYRLFRDSSAKKFGIENPPIRPDVRIRNGEGFFFSPSNPPWIFLGLDSKDNFWMGASHEYSHLYHHLANPSIILQSLVGEIVAEVSANEFIDSLGLLRYVRKLDSVSHKRTLLARSLYDSGLRISPELVRANHDSALNIILSKTGVSIK